MHVKSNHEFKYIEIIEHTDAERGENTKRNEIEQSNKDTVTKTKYIE